MAIATRPKPSVSHKKRRAQHHRHSKPYLKTYWPYLPMLLIIGAGAAVNHYWPQAVSAALVPGDLFSSSGQPYARVQTLVGNQSQTLLLAVVAITAIAFAIFVFRHWYRFHRVLNRGEKFVSEHPWFDIATVAVFTIGFILAR